MFHVKGALFLFLLFPVVLLAQDYEVTVSTVTVWVKATAKSGDSPAKGLTAEDFDLFEDDKKQPLTCFEEIKTAAPSPAQQTAVSAVPRKFVLYLDLFNMTAAELGQIKPALKDFLRQISGKNYEVMVAALVPAGKLGVIAPFTKEVPRLIPLMDMAKANSARDAGIHANESQLIAALEQLRDEGEEPVDSLADLTVANPSKDFNTRLMRSVYQLAQSYEKEEAAGTELSLSALEGFAGYLAKQNPNDHVVILYVSGGFNVNPGRRYYELIERVAEAKGMRSDSLTYAVRVSGSKRDDQSHFLREVQHRVGKLNRQNTTLYSISTRGLVAGNDSRAKSSMYSTDESKIVPDYLDSLRQIADETGGLSFQNSQNYKAGFDGILQDLEHQYVLCYSPPEHTKSGAYHKIKVVGNKSGIELRHRQGYVD